MFISNLNTVLVLVVALLSQTISATAIFTAGDPDNGSSPGIILRNKSAAPSSYYFYKGAGNFDVVFKYVYIPAGKSVFISIPVPWQGYIQRGTDQLNLNGAVNMPMTMVEFRLGASDGTGAHGDISLEQGYDGSATICSTTTGACGGFTQNIFHGAPIAAFEKKPGPTTLASWQGVLAEKNSQRGPKVWSF